MLAAIVAMHRIGLVKRRDDDGGGGIDDAGSAPGSGRSEGEGKGAGEREDVWGHRGTLAEGPLDRQPKPRSAPHRKMVDMVTKLS